MAYKLLTITVEIRRKFCLGKCGLFKALKIKARFACELLTKRT